MAATHRYVTKGKVVLFCVFGMYLHQYLKATRVQDRHYSPLHERCVVNLPCFDFNEASAVTLSPTTLAALEARKHSCPRTHDFESIVLNQTVYYYEVPQVIHQVWIGAHAPPSALLDTWRSRYIQTCRGWSYKLWTESDISSLKYLPVSYYNSEPTLNGKSDWLRSAIMFEHGGVYIDADTQWVNEICLDDVVTLASTTGFLVALEPGKAHAAPGVMFSVPHHPVVSRMIAMQIAFSSSPLSRGAAAWQRVGPGAITAALATCDNHCKGGRMSFAKPHALFTLINSKYFYPVGWTQHNYSLVRNQAFVAELARQKYPTAIMYQLGLSTHTGEQRN